jgi:hypothetical protein
MKTYSVLITVDASIVVKVEANSEEEAKEIAMEVAETPSICHHCTRRVEVGELLQVVEVIEVAP